MKVSSHIIVLLFMAAHLAAGKNALAGTSINDTRERAEERRQQQLPPDQPIDFVSLRKKADDLSAKQDENFKLHQAELEFDSSTLRINQVNFHYFRPTPAGGATSKWDKLQVNVNTGGRVTTGRTVRSSYPGTIGMNRQSFSDPQPTAAPANLLTPEDAIRRLNRSPLSSPFSAPSYLKDPSQWKLNVQLIRVGAQYMAGTVTLSPPGPGRIGWIERAIQPSIHDPFFKQTAPAGKWVWWTVAQHSDVPGERYEYIYIDAASGKATSHCAEPSGPRNAVVPVPVPCGPPLKTR